MSVCDAKELSRSYLGDLRPRWDHVRAVGWCAEDLIERCGLPERVAIAAWLHDVGYSPELAVSGFHPLDGAQFLTAQGVPAEVVRLVAWHTGAGFEATERGLLGQLEQIAQPAVVELDALTMIDLATSPVGEAVLDVDRIAEILSRYEDGHPVHDAVAASRDWLLASSARAKRALGLPHDWPVCA